MCAVGPDQRDALCFLLNDSSLAKTYDKDGTFVATWRGVGVSFFRLQLYPLVQVPLLLDSIPLATIPEIGAMKLAAMIDHGTRKDMVDLCYLLKVVSLETIFEVAAVKYARVRSFSVSAIRALACFADAEVLPMPRMLEKTSWLKMKKFLERQAMEAERKNSATCGGRFMGDSVGSLLRDFFLYVHRLLQSPCPSLKGNPSWRSCITICT